MPVVKSEHAVAHTLNDTRFDSYVAPSRGSTELCAWRVEIPPGTAGLPHTVSREEVLLILSGAVRVHLDDAEVDASVGDVVHVPAGAAFAVDNPSAVPATAWVCTTVGLEAVLADGTRLRPPWTV